MATNQQKRRAIERYRAGDKVGAIAKEAGVNPSTVCGWAQEAGCPKRTTRTVNSYKYDYARRADTTPAADALDDIQGGHDGSR